MNLTQCKCCNEVEGLGSIGLVIKGFMGLIACIRYIGSIGLIGFRSEAYRAEGLQGQRFGK